MATDQQLVQLNYLRTDGDLIDEGESQVDWLAFCFTNVKEGVCVRACVCGCVCARACVCV